MKGIMIKTGKLLILSIAIEAICSYLGSPFLVNYLAGNIVIIVITLMAINTATCSFIVSKLHEISKEKGVSFTKVYKEIKYSLFSQIFLLALSIVVLIASTSTTIKPLFSDDFLPKAKLLRDVILVFTFVASIEILRDTGVSMFDILIELEKNEKKNTN